MRLKLTKPLLVFDLETTGLNIATESIIQLAYVKVMPDGTETRGNIMINPGKPIPEEITNLTGISDSMVKDAPLFKDVANELYDLINGCDLAGFNSNHFDVPLLVEEFLRVGIQLHLDDVNLVDAHSIFCKMEQRNLAAAYKFYCGHKMEEDFEAHRADQDAEATWRVLKGELEMYSSERQTEEARILPDTPEALSALTKNDERIDLAGRLIMQNGVETFNFGKYKGKAIAEVLSHDPGYYQWVMGGVFTLDTKNCLNRIYLKMKKK